MILFKQIWLVQWIEEMLPSIKNQNQGFGRIWIPGPRLLFPTGPLGPQIHSLFRNNFLFSKSSHKDDVWINPFIRPPICSIIIAVSISFVGACLLYLDRDQSIILTKKEQYNGINQDFQNQSNANFNFRLNYGRWFLLVVVHCFY